MRTALLFLLFPLAALAQNDAWPQAKGAEKPQAGTISVDYTEVRAGPGAAYVSRGRVYQGDAVQVVRRNDAGDWTEIEAGGMAGWVRSKYVRLGGAPAVRRDEKGQVDAGRDRKQSNYGYDEQGRRLGPDGRPVGSGEGIDEAAEREFLREASPASSPDESVLSVRLTVGASQVRRVFSSDLEDSALRNLELAPTGLRYGLAVDYKPIRYLIVRAAFYDNRLHEATITANPDFGFERDAALAVEAQQVEVDVVGRYPFGPAWAGVYGGLHVLRHAFQQTQPLLLLTNTFIGVAGGGAAGARFGPVDFTVRGGVFFPVSVSQEPADGGEADAFGFDASAEIGWSLTKSWAVVGDVHFQRVQTDFTGGGTHVDTAGDEAPYQQALETDSVLGGGLGVRWSW